MSMQSKKTVYVPVSGSGKQVYHTDQGAGGWHTIARAGSGKQVYHTDRECTHLSRSVVREISLDVLHEDSTECVRCERGHGGGGVRSRAPPSTKIPLYILTLITSTNVQF